MSYISKKGKFLNLFFYLLVSLFIVKNKTSGQVLKVSYGGGTGDDVIHAMIQNRAGKLIVAGQSDSKLYGKDGFVEILQQQIPDTISITTTTRRSGDDGIHQLLQASDGAYWGVGFTNDVGWIFKSTKIEQLEFEYEDANPERTGNELLDLAEDNKGNIYATGYHKDHLLLMKWDREGKACKGFPYRFPRPSLGTALTVTSGNEVLLTGCLKGRRGRDSLLVLKIDESGKEISRRHWPDARGKAIQVGETGSILVGGVALHSDLGESALLLQLQLDGELEVVELPREVGNSAILAMERPNNNVVALAGYSASYRPGAQRPMGLCRLAPLHDTAYPLREYFLNNKKYDSQSHAILNADDGNIYFAGTAYLGRNKGYEGFIAKVSNESYIESVNFINPISRPDQTVVEHAKYNIEIEALLKSKTAIAPTDYPNWQVVRQQVVGGTKDFIPVTGMDEVGRPGPNSDYWEYKITSNIILDKGLNSIRVIHRNGMRTDSSRSELLINYRASKLFILAIGVPYPDLLYTGKDARAIENTFAAQAGKYYGAVESVILDSKQETTYQNIKSEVVKYNQYRRNNQIGEDDVLLVFISAHGKLIDDEFYLIPDSLIGRSDSIIERRGINFKHDMLSRLEKINCTKIFLIDACHSGGGVQKVLGDVENQAKTLVISSSKANQRSYEDEAWGHGAFTAAILKALDKQRIKSLDTNNDSLLSDKEFFKFVQKEVKEMVKKVNGKNQVPVLFKSKGEDFIIYRY